MRLLQSAKYILAVIVGCVFTSVSAQDSIYYKASAIGSISSGDFAPYYISSLNNGIMPHGDNALLRVSAWKPISTATRFSWGFGVDVLSGYSSTVDYLEGNPANPTGVSTVKLDSLWVQQLYAEVKYRGVFLTAGLKQQESKMLNNRLSSGDWVESGNARPIPEVRVGFIDFQNIPFTKGWMQICGAISYGRSTDSRWVKQQYNHFNSHIAQNTWYSYKYAYFRTNPNVPFSVTFGAQAAATFGGYSEYYYNGVQTKVEKRTATIVDMFDMFIPSLSSKEGYVAGNHLGSWDIMARYRFKDNTELKAYVQWPWEDGSGIGKLNGFDGIWGLEYSSGKQSWINGAVIEYIDLTNQSGPLHWAPHDTPGTTITGQATGGDEYYNNAFYNPYSHYGMSIGSPFLPSPLYNKDGYPQYIDNLVRGFHVGVMGNINNNLEYRVLGGYRKGWGDGRIPRANAVENTSFMAEATYSLPMVDGLKFKAQFAFDQGEMYGDNFGGSLTVSYSGNFNIGKK